MITKESIYILVGAVVFGLLVWFIVSLVNKKEKYLEIEKKQERNESNERYEIIPESLYQNQNASSPYPPEPIMPFKIYDPQNINVDIIEITCDDNSVPLSKDNKENFQALEIDVIGITEQKPKSKPSTFCTCGGLIHQDCRSTFQRVDNYNKGTTEFAKFPDKGWNDVMPYDKWTEEPNYYKQNTNWFDVMPYDIYQSN